VVGNNLATDVAGAQAAGPRATWLNRKRALAGDEVFPEAGIQSLAALADLLKPTQPAVVNQ